MNDAELKIGITVDSGTGAVKIKQLGDAGKEAGDQVDAGMRKGGKSLADFDALAGTAAAGIGVVVAAVGAATAALGAMVVATANQAREMENLSRLAGMNAGDFEAYAYATQKYGIEAENLADISKDVKDKLGDFIATGGGEFADFFENIAPKVGLTAQELAKLSGPDALVAVKKAMDDANVSAAEQVFYLESLGNDASKLIPLLADNGAELQNMADRGRELGVALSSIQHQKLLDAATASEELTTAIGSTKDMVAAELAPVFVEIFADITRLLVDNRATLVGWATATSNAFQTAWENIQLFFVAMIDVVMSGWIKLSYGGKEAALTITSVFGVMADDVMEIMADLLASIADKMGAVSFTVSNPFGDDWTIGFAGAASSLDGHADKLRNASTANEDYQRAITSLLKERQNELAIHQEVIDEMAGEILQRKETVVATEAMTTSTTAATEATSALGATSKEAAKQLESISDALDKMFAKEAAEAIKQQEQQVAARLKLETDLTDKTKQLTLSELDYKKWALEQEIAQMRTVAGEDAQLQDQISQYRLARLEDMRTGTNDLTEYMADRWKEAYDGIQDTLVEFVKTGELSFDSILDLFKNMLAEMLATWLMYVGKMAFSDLMSGGTMSMGQIFGLDQLTGGGGLLSTATSGVSLASGVQTAGSWLGIGGAAAVSPYVAGGGQLLGTAAAAGGAVPVTIAGSTLPGGMGFGYGGSVGASTATSTSSVSLAGMSAMWPMAALAGAVLLGETMGTQYSRQTISTGVDDHMLRVTDKNEDGTIGLDDMQRNMKVNLDNLSKYAEAIDYTGDRASESGAEMMSASQATALLSQSVTAARGEVETMAFVFGNTTAQMALDMDGSVASTNTFLDALAGYDVSMSDATRLNWLASEAASGTAGAADALYSALLTMTGSADDARIGVMGMIAAVNELSATPLNIDVQVNSSTVSSVSSASSAADIAAYKSSFVDSWATSKQYHATGGVMTMPTEFYPGHVGGEAGDELIMPLSRGPQMFDDMYDAVVGSSAGSSGGLQDLREDMTAGNVAIITELQAVRKIFTKWDKAGQPAERVL